MKFCGNCGTELSPTVKFCPNCGTPTDNAAAPASSIINQEKLAAIVSSVKSKLSDSKVSLSGILSAVDNLGSAKNMFFAAVGTLLLNLLFALIPMADVSMIFSSKNMTILGFFKAMREYTGRGGDADFMIPIFTVCYLLLAAAIVLSVLPLILGKTYSRKFLALNYIALIVNFIVYALILLAFKDTNYSYLVKANAMAYIYLIENFAAFVCTVIFSKKLKSIS